jgi:hypothetical protein
VGRLPLLRLLGLGLLALAAGLWLPGLRTFLAVDACLDRGGSYDHVRHLCDGGESPRSSPPP